MRNDVICGDCEVVLKKFPAAAFDAVVTDAPYDLNLHGASWDQDVPSPALWDQVRRVLKPGAMIVAFGSPRTYHRLVTRIEASQSNLHDRLEIRDTLIWVHEAGVNKSKDVSLTIDRFGGNEDVAAARYALRDHIRMRMVKTGRTRRSLEDLFAKKHVVASWLGPDFHGLRTPVQEDYDVLKEHIGCKQAFLDAVRNPKQRKVIGVKRGTRSRLWMEEGRTGFRSSYEATAPATVLGQQWQGWGACLSPTMEPIVLARRSFSGSLGLNLVTHGVGALNLGSFKDEDGRLPTNVLHCPKPSQAERGRSTHPALKPIELLRRLIRLVAPPGSRILDPFAGSGTTGAAAVAEGCSCVLIEQDKTFAAEARRCHAGSL